MTAISSIIIEYQTSLDDLHRLVKQLREPAVEVIVVDNGQERSTSARKRLQEMCTYLSQATNRGFGTAANIGAQYAQSEWLLFLNPDVDIHGHGVLEMVQKAESAEFDACCPVTTDSRYMHSLPSFVWFLSEYTPLKRLLGRPVSIKEDAQMTLWGGCLLIKKCIFEKIGGFDEKFFLWFEDSDLTKRLIESGAHIGRVPCQYTHKGGASFTALEDHTRKKWYFTSAIRYARKHLSICTQLLTYMLYSRYVLLPEIWQRCSQKSQ